MRAQHLFGTVLIAVIFGLLGGYMGSLTLEGRVTKPKMVGPQETAYQRVMRTKTLRCGYVVHPPHIIKDFAADAVTGSVADIMNEAGRLLDIKIAWPEEVGWGNTVEALRSGRIDAVCTDFWMNPIEGRYVNYSMPLYYETVMAYARDDDHRFDKGLDAVNDPSVRVATIDGAVNGIIAQQDFPKATLDALPNMTDDRQILNEVEAGKADIVFVGAQDGAQFMRNNPGKLKNLTPDKPVRAFPATIGLPQNDVALKVMLDSAFVQLLYSRFVDKTLAKYGLPPDVVYRVARPYESSPASAASILSNSTESAKTLPTQ